VTFWEHFLRLLPYKPIEALQALYWHITRRKVRARNRLRVASVDLPFAYDLWIERIERSASASIDLRDAMQRWAFRPQFSVLLYGDADCRPQQVQRSIESLERQGYPFWTLLDTPLSSVVSGVAAANGDYIILLRAGDVLASTAFFRFAEALQSRDRPAIVYGDQDELDEQGRRRRPWFKPQWNEELFLAQDYLSRAVAIDTRLAKNVPVEELESIAGLMLAATASAEGTIVHVPHILVHVAGKADEESRLQWLRAAAGFLQPLGASCALGPFGTVKVQWPLPEELPLVSIVVPTRDRLDLLRPCIDGVLEKTDYANFEILVLDNESVDERTIGYLTRVSEDPRVRVVPHPGPYNFSSFNNFAAREARGSFLCLLNNDTEVVEPKWLTEMMRYAVRPEVGAVGAKLLYDDGSIQHAGVVVGIGSGAGHAHRFLPSGDPGYFHQPHVTQFVSAVTAACLVIDKRKFLAVGGLDETELPVAFNDVDFCLKLQLAGWRNVYVPHAVLVHHESKSRGADFLPENIDRYRRELAVLQERWGTETYSDPLHNPNLDRHIETFALRL
jgi:GT2 family glycosyltransferase